MILNIAQSTNRESSLAIAPILLEEVEEVEEVYSDNSNFIKETLLYQISRIVINTRIVVEVDDFEIIASRGIMTTAYMKVI
ncbi:uncharacterized protein RSE6_11625 [Rhynchosporium secalis]|uniref:Uncharacterized protein n=1 Tax=Rhynchosporium secalis TaxID=38038 RepID=A0A1E1MNE6_RHYSE|nr:uncharacterized protein RSE6_11625 [Rhynchosporium secalis]